MPQFITMNVESIPEDLRRQMKALAALKGVTLREALIEAMQDWCAAERGSQGYGGNASGSGGTTTVVGRGGGGRGSGSGAAGTNGANATSGGGGTGGMA